MVDWLNNIPNATNEELEPRTEAGGGLHAPSKENVTWLNKIPSGEPKSVRTQENFNLVQDVNPDEQAALYNKSKTEGIPLSILKETPDVSQLPRESVDILEQSDALPGYYANVENTSISKDDIPELWNVEQTTFEKVKERWKFGDINSKINYLINYRDFQGADPDKINARIEQLKAHQAELEEPRGFIEKTVTGLAEQLPQIAAGVERGIVRAGEVGIPAATAAVIAGQIGPQFALPEELITAPAAFAAFGGPAFVVGMSENIFIQEYGGALEEYLNTTDESGKKLDPVLSRLMATTTGLANVIPELVSVKKVIETFPGGKTLIRKMTSDTIKNVVKSKTVRRQLAEILGRFGIAVGAEIGEEVVQESITVLLREIGKNIAETTEGVEFKDFDVDAFADRIGQTIDKSFYTSFGFALPGSAASTAMIRSDVEISKKSHDSNNDINTTINATKTKQRSTDHAENFLNTIGMGQPVYISPEGIDLLYQNAPDEANGILEKAGIRPEEARKSAAAGVDIDITQAKAHGQLTTEEYNLIKNDIKPSPGSYTQRELDAQIAEEDIENAVKLNQEQVEVDKAVNAEIVRIKDEAKKAKEPVEVVENVPILMKGLADRLSLEGVNMVEFLKKIGVKKERFAGVRGVVEQGLKFLQPERPDAPPRGAITINNEQHLISLFETSDQTTLVHETGHIFLKEATALIDAGQATEALQADMDIIRQWVGAEKGAEFTTENIEQFAKGFEAYLLEGKAPSIELQSAFARFQRWLTQVYKTAKRLDVKLDNKIRGVFDRMLSANLEVEAMAQTGGFTVKTTEEMTALGVTTADQTLMTQLMDITIAKASRKYNEARNKGLAGLRKGWREEARRELRNENPIYNIVDEISKEQVLQIDRDDFIERYGQEVVDQLPNKRILKKDAHPVDVAANFFDFDDTDSFVEALIEAEPFTAAVNQRVAQKQSAHDAQFKVEDYFTDIKEYRDYLNIVSKSLSRGQVTQEDIDAGVQRNISRWEKESAKEIANEQPDLTGTELSAAITARTQEKIERFETTQKGRQITSTESLRRFAKKTINALTIKEARRTDKFLSAMKKAAANERRAIMRKDFGAASEANERVRFNYEMAGQSRKVRDETAAILNRAKRIGRDKSKRIENEHREAIKHLIDMYQIAPIVPDKPAVIPNWNTLFAGDDTSSGYVPPDFMFRNITNDYRELSIDQLRDVDSAIRYLEGQGKEDKTDVLSNGDSLSDTAGQSVAVMEKMKVLKKWEKGSMMRRLTDLTRSFFSLLDSLTFIGKSMDGYTNLGKVGVKGPFERNVLDRIKAALNQNTILKGEIDEQLQPHMNQIFDTIRTWQKKAKGRKIFIEDVPVPQLLRNDGQKGWWTGDQIFAVLLNLGNDQNIQRLQSGFFDLTDAHIDTLKDFVSKKDWQSIQGIWDTMEGLFPETNSVHLRMENYNLKKVEATPVRSRHGVFRGGYYPAAYDPNLDFGVDDRKAVEDLFAKEAAGFSVPYTLSGHTQQRVNGVALPMLLDLSVIPKHFDNAVQYINLAEVIKDADRITRQADFRNAAVNVLGKDVYKTIRPALKHIANPRRAGLDLPGHSLLEKVRGLSTLYILAHNTGVAIKQPLSTFGAIHDMGLRPYLNGFFSTLSAPSMHFNRMLELSAYMKNRQTSFDRELKSSFNKLSGKQKVFYFGEKVGLKPFTWQDVQNFGFWQIRLADTVTVMPIWNGAFNDKLNADQSNLQEAINYADDMVRNSQPSAQPLDLSTWQRDGGILRIFSQFQTFTVGKYGQRQRLHYRAWKEGAISAKDYAWFNFMDAALPLVSISMLQAFIWGRDVEDEEVIKDMMIDVATGWAFMGVPLASGIINSFKYGDAFRSPVLETANRAVAGAYSVGVSLADFDDDKKRARALWGLGHGLSIISGVPLSKIVQKAVKGAEQDKGLPGVKLLVPAPKGK